MAVPVATKKYESGDFYIREGLSREYYATSILVTNSTTFAWSMSPGQPFTNAVPTVAASVAALTSILIDSEVMAAGEVRKLPVFGVASGTPRLHGLVLNYALIPPADMSSPTGASIDPASYKSAVENFGARVHNEGTPQELQSK